MLTAPGAFTGTQPPSRRVLHPLNVGVKLPPNDPSDCSPRGLGRRGPQRTPLWRRCGRRRQSPAAPPAGPLRRRLSKCPAAPLPARPLAAAVAGSPGWGVGTTAPLLVLSSQIPHCPDHRAQFPRPGRPQAAEGAAPLAAQRGRAVSLKLSSSIISTRG
jgi:hypothetical protein